MSLIDIRHISKTFEGRKVLDDISLSVEEGDIYGILGLSGAGKSTLVRCINGLENIDEGEIRYDGKLLCSAEKQETRDRKGNVKDKSVVTKKVPREKKSEIAMIFQSFNLLQQKSVLKNVMLGLEINHVGANRRERERLARDALMKVDLLDKEKAYPSQLSGGQQQRVAIARVLALNPKVILSDEATSALDPETTDSILSLLKSLNRDYGLTIIMISHQMQAIEEICNKVAIIDKARIVESGPMQDVFLNPETPIAKKLIYSNKIHSNLDDQHSIRIIFDGNADEPLLSNIVTDCRLTVSVVFADTRVVDNQVYGQMIIKCPDTENDLNKLEKYLDIKGFRYEVVGNEY